MSYRIHFPSDPQEEVVFYQNIMSRPTGDIFVISSSLYQTFKDFVVKPNKMISSLGFGGTMMFRGQDFTDRHMHVILDKKFWNDDDSYDILQRFIEVAIPSGFIYPPRIVTL